MEMKSFLKKKNAAKRSFKIVFLLQLVTKLSSIKKGTYLFQKPIIILIRSVPAGLLSPYDTLYTYI